VNGVTWFGHSTVVIEIDGTRLVADPVLGRRVAHLSREAAVPRDELGRIDGVLVSHVHLDHLDVSSLAQFDRSLPVVVPKGAGGILRRRGFGKVHEVEPGDEVCIGSVRVEVVHAEHGVVRRFLRSSTSALGFVAHGSHDVYFAGDTDLFDWMRDFGPLDVALVPIAGWGPRLPPGHLDPERAAQALTLLRPIAAVPVHWGTFSTPFGEPAGAEPVEAFRRAAEELAPDVRVRVLRHGESLHL